MDYFRFEYSENKKQKITIAFDGRIHIRGTGMTKEMKDKLYEGCIIIKQFLEQIGITTSIRGKYYIGDKTIKLQTKKEILEFSFDGDLLSIKEIVNE